MHHNRGSSPPPLLLPAVQRRFSRVPLNLLPPRDGTASTGSKAARCLASYGDGKPLPTTAPIVPPSMRNTTETLHMLASIATPPAPGGAMNYTRYLDRLLQLDVNAPNAYTRLKALGKCCWRRGRLRLYYDFWTRRPRWQCKSDRRTEHGRVTDQRGSCPGTVSALIRFEVNDLNDLLFKLKTPAVAEQVIAKTVNIC